MGFGGGGSPAPAPATTTVQQNSVPPFLESAYLQGINRADAASQAPYTPYAGQRLAGFTPEQTQAQNMVQQGIGQFMPTYNAGVDATQAATTPFNSSSLDAYMNPYTSNITNEIARLGNQNFTNNILPGINSQFTGGGMFGSSRNAVALGRAAEATQADITGQQSQALQQGYGQALNAYQADQQRKLAAGAQLTNQATQGQSLYGGDVNALAATGQQQQQLQQQGLDTAYNDFLIQQQYPQAQAQYFNNIVRGIPQAGLVTSQKQEYGGTGSPISQALGLGATLYGATNPAPKISLNKGGHIKAKKMKAKSYNAGLGNEMYG